MTIIKLLIHNNIWLFFRRKKLLISSLGLLSFISFLTAAGGLLGYLLAKWSGGRKAGIAGRIRSVIFKIGKYRFHFHHWLIGLPLLFLGIFDILPFLKEAMVQGMIIGVIFQGIFDYPDWYRIMKKDL